MTMRSIRNCANTAVGTTSTTTTKTATATDSSTNTTANTTTTRSVSPLSETSTLASKDLLSRKKTNVSTSTRKATSTTETTTTMTTTATAKGPIRVIKHSPMTRQRRLVQQVLDNDTVTSPTPGTNNAAVKNNNKESSSRSRNSDNIDNVVTTTLSTSPVQSPVTNVGSMSLAEQLPRLVADTTQLRHALVAFEYAYAKQYGWADKYYQYLIDAGIDSMNALYNGCKDDTINLDLDFIGICPNERLDYMTLMSLQHFLPGPVGIRCFRLAQMAAEKVRRGEADVKYVHRPENGRCGEEIWRVVPHGSSTTLAWSSPYNKNLTTNTDSNNNGSSTSTATAPWSATSNSSNNSSTLTSPTPQWTLHVDCAGFVRSVLKHITKDVVQVSLSDRSFMRAKDFYRFFETIDRTVIDFGSNSSLSARQQHQQQQYSSSMQQQQQYEQPRKILQWKLITDLRMVIPGDIIVYRPKGNAAGGAAFTLNDRSDLKHLLKAVKVALLYHNEMAEHGPNHLVTRNLGRDPSIKEYVDFHRSLLNSCGIQSCSQLRTQLRTNNLNNLVKEKVGTTNTDCYDELTIKLMIECSTTTAKNTGHIVFAAGPPILVDPDTNEYRVKVVHSTKHGVNHTEGVQQYYRRFQLIEGHNGPQWTRPQSVAVAPTIAAATTCPIPSVKADTISTGAGAGPLTNTQSTITSDIASLSISLSNSSMDDNQDIHDKSNVSTKNKQKKQKQDISAIHHHAVVVDEDGDDIDDEEMNAVTPPSSPSNVTNLKRKTSSRSSTMNNCTYTNSQHPLKDKNNDKNNFENDSKTVANDNITSNNDDIDDEDYDVDGDDPEDEDTDVKNENDVPEDVGSGNTQQSIMASDPLGSSSPKTGDVHLIRNDEDYVDPTNSSKCHVDAVNQPAPATSTVGLSNDEILLMELINEGGGMKSSSMNDELAGQADVEVLAARMCF